MLSFESASRHRNASKQRHKPGILAVGGDNKRGAQPASGTSLAATVSDLRVQPFNHRARDT